MAPKRKKSESVESGSLPELLEDPPGKVARTDGGDEGGDSDDDSGEEGGSIVPPSILQNVVVEAVPLVPPAPVDGGGVGLPLPLPVAVQAAGPPGPPHLMGFPMHHHPYHPAHHMPPPGHGHPHVYAQAPGQGNGRPSDSFFLGDTHAPLILNLPPPPPTPHR